MKNECWKTRPVERPYERYKSPVLPGWEWRVLKKYQSPYKERDNQLAMWYCAVRSPHTYGAWEYGDVYVKDILEVAQGYKLPTENI